VKKPGPGFVEDNKGLEDQVVSLPMPIKLWQLPRDRFDLPTNLVRPECSPDQNGEDLIPCGVYEIIGVIPILVRSFGLLEALFP
jgi:hypothetical protein